MTAEEIRNSQFQCDDGAWESAHWLKEIAAQLADLNERWNASPIQLLMYAQAARDMIAHYLERGYLPALSSKEAELLVENLDQVISDAKRGAQ